MQSVYTIVVFVFVIAVLGTVAFALFEVTPLARHKDRFRDARGRRIESPKLD